MAVNYTVDKHTVCELGNLIAQEYGEHIVSLKIDEAIDNGRIVKVKDMVSLDQYDYEAATAIDAKIVDKNPNGTWLVLVKGVSDDLTALIYQKPLIAYESPKNLTSLSAFYNDPADGPVRGYILHALDRFSLSEDGFEGTPAKGATISAISNGKLVVA